MSVCEPSEGIYELPEELLRHILTYVKFTDFGPLFLTCKAFNKLGHELEMWQFWIERDYLKDYQAYVENINNKNSERDRALIVRDKINPLYVLINKAFANLQTHIDSLRELMPEDNGDFYTPDIEEVNGEFGNLKDELQSHYQDIISNGPLEDLSLTDPMALYERFLNENSIIPCMNIIPQKYTQIHKQCGKNSVPRRNYCQDCIVKNRNIVMLPVFKPILPSVLPFPPINKAPQLPFGGTLEPFPLMQSFAMPKRLECKQFDKDKFVSTEKPYFVIKIVGGENHLVGVNDEGSTVRRATEEERILAKELGIYF